jgi:hypothetical protein
VVVKIGQASRMQAGGVPEPPRAVEARAAFAWLREQAYQNLKIELALVPAAAGPPTTAVVSLRNVGSRPMSVMGYHPLGVNYQLEVRRPGERTPEFVKLAPRTIRRHVAPGATATLAETRGPVRLDPGAAYELELDLRSLMKGPGTYLLAGHYLGFEPPAPGADPQGYTLRSSDVKWEVP